MKGDLSRKPRTAEKDDVITTRHGVAAGILIGFEDPRSVLVRARTLKIRLASTGRN
jgi:hypothetical protein